jgi:hypothetical protein
MDLCSHWLVITNQQCRLQTEEMEAVANIALENVQMASACVLPPLGAVAEGKNIPQEECVPMS